MSKTSLLLISNYYFWKLNFNYQNMKFFILPIVICLYLSSLGQNNASKIYNATHLKKGFYRNYEEFINNNPSDTTDFIVNKFVKSKSDSAVFGAEYTLVDSTKKVHHVWGFCDGTSVFINYSESPFTKHYWKLLGLGPNAFFEIKQKEIFLIGGPLMKLATAAISAAVPAQFEFKRINTNGKFRSLDILEMRDLLEKYPTLLKEFRAKTDSKVPLDSDPRRNKSLPQLTDADIKKQDEAIIEYLNKLNDVLRQK